jgi:23S rRNA pseudouridine1911/1915/1917 synthase
MSEGRLRLTVGDEAGGVRLDVFLAKHHPEASRSVWKRIIEAGRVDVDGRRAEKAGIALSPGMAIDALLPEPEASQIEGENIPVAFAHEDAHIAVVVKPAGLVVHPGSGVRSGTLVHALVGRGLALAPAGGVLRPGIVHRLDKDTSGLLIVAKTDAAHRALTAMFARREIVKTYAAILWGRPLPADGRIEDAIGRSRRDRTKMSVGAPGSRSATTIYRTTERFRGATMVDIDLVTGRTHQIRVHFAFRHHPVLGDTRYGGAPWKQLQDVRRRAIFASFPRLALHARSLAFAHPVTGTPIALQAPLPSDLVALVDTLRREA